ncbi:MAG: hypothetical protein JNJ83_21140 [Verrucomicrobiaceae bacterium]|nr:hypothetical protein [Verrucomicrobiaceae bacterium]
MMSLLSIAQNRRHLCVIAAIGILGLLVDAFAQGESRRRLLIPPPAEGGGAPVPGGKPMTQSLKLAGDYLLKTELTGEGFTLKDQTGATLLERKEKQRVTEKKLSPNAEVALLRIDKFEKNFGWYRGLVRVRVSDKGLVVDELWDTGTDLFPGRRWWVSEIGALSDDGEVALLKLGISGENNGPIEYSWQTWQLNPAKQLGSGLTVANGAQDSAKPAKP